MSKNFWVLTIICIAVFTIAMVISVSISETKKSQNVTLQELSVATKANAECISNINNGQCSKIDNTCWTSAPYWDCDTWGNW
jgi:hypothetical protein